MKKRGIITFLIMFAAFFMAGCADDETNAILEPRYYEGTAGQVHTIENESLKLELDGDTTTFQLTNKKTGQIWYSNPNERDTLGKGEGIHQDVLSSTLLVRYSSKIGNEVDIDNYTQSIVNKNYIIHPIDQTSIKVDYSVGDVDKVFVCPPVAGEARMQEFLSKMGKTTQKSVMRQYVEYNYEELEGEELDQALTMFPDLEKEPMYVLNDNISDSYGASVEKEFMAAGYTKEDYTQDKAKYPNVGSGKETAVFNISVYYILDGEDFIVKVPMEEIQYNNAYPMVELTMLPYMGAGSTEDSGYVLVPDGTGGIINFNNGKTDQQLFTSEMYGWDYGVFRDAVVDETKSHFPVYGIARNEEAFISTAEEGSAYAVVRADISGKGNGYNYGRIAYKIAHGEDMDISNKSDTTVRIFERELPKENILQRYIFSPNTDYVSLAGKYRDYLMKRYPHLKKKEDRTNVPMTVEMVGAVERIEHILGYPVTKPHPLTTYEQAKTMIDNMVKEGVNPNELAVKYSSWYNTGVKPSTSTRVKTVGRLGSESELEDLAAYANDNGVDLFLEGTFNFVYKDGLFDGFTTRRDAAKFVSREIVEWWPFSEVSYVPADWIDDSSYYMTKPSYSQKSLENYAQEAEALGTKNIAFTDYGYRLGADYNPKDPVSREKAMNMEAESMKKLKENGSKLMIKSGFQYAALQSDYITNLPIDFNKVNMVDEKIPFYTIALHGLVDYAGEAVNLAGNYDDNLLKSVENGAGLYYVMMQEKTTELQSSFYTKYFACNYDEWKDSVFDTYERFSTELGDTYNQYIVRHERLAEGVYLTGYENGKEVIVNYNFNDYNAEGIIVPKRDFITRGGGSK
ncbi:MAG: DUF5696 domain-containing protein [Lachnoclostridium sp.]|jgi:hypothetical protein|nr:DUF5696 domain-containing protein [Lachnoclostridium sp.]